MTTTPHPAPSAARQVPGPGREDRFASLPAGARLLAAGVILAGGAAIVLAAALARFDHPLALAGFIALSSLTSTLKLPLPLKHGQSGLSVSYAVDVAALLTLGPYEATLVTAVSGWSQQPMRWPSKSPAPRSISVTS
jgi:hypothetical protein